MAVENRFIVRAQLVGHYGPDRYDLHDTHLGGFSNVGTIRDSTLAYKIADLLNVDHKKTKNA